MSDFLDPASSSFASQRIAELLQRERISAAQLAAQLRAAGHEVTNHSVWRSATGRTKVRRDLIDAIARLADYLPGDFVCDRPLPEPATAPVLQPGATLNSRRAFAVAFDRVRRSWEHNSAPTLGWRRRVPRRDPKACANYLRSKLRLGIAPVRSVGDAIAAAGIVRLLDAPALPDNRVCAGWCGNQAFVLVPRYIERSFGNSSELRVHVAEELGLVAMYSPRHGGFPKPEVAHEFARRFLVPDAARKLAHTAKHSPPNQCRSIARYYGVPLGLLVERLRDWGLSELAESAVGTDESTCEPSGESWDMADFFGFHAAVS